MDADTELRELAPPAFTHAVPALLQVYEAAMRPPPEQLPGRASVMNNHAGHPGFRAVVAVRGGHPVGFAYAFHGCSGQWWHDTVVRELHACGRTRQVRRYLSDPLEIAEVHVHPRAQGRGVGRSLLHALCRGRPEPTAVLSTRSGPSVARHLYRSCGFTEVLEDFSFPGSPGQPFSIMAARLPLAGSGDRRSPDRSAWWPWTGSR
ncbi:MULTISPECIES: GNAT family N-acetyltransferase [Nocardiopsis]|uniref:GNAT family N-acetyltransferase n=1 Tax=Nocardiopsis sinuspersici TaxID=501010 RepID=A0A1V3C1P4_9ACTN|nr:MULTISPECIES: GNAT family N-acetyltransferase [Nocardiopsis]NYH50864.1 ribosomal protein S18 acetylase RimI-like enzyme [Nocardiopsis sinuspersici]OOC54687.1 GNAT family N-acetyltransferase [Nocardiopsis sinuspersici]